MNGFQFNKNLFTEEASHPVRLMQLYLPNSYKDQIPDFLKKSGIYRPVV